MQLHVGLTNIAGGIERYAERFDLLELRIDPEKLPSNPALKKMRSRAPKLITSFFLPARAVSSVLTTPDAIQPIIAAADLLGSSWVVLQTGTELGPSQRTKDRLAALSERLLASSRKVAWEPHGIWDDEASEEFAKGLGISLVQDLSVARGSGPEVIYTRLRSLGPGAQLRSSALEHLAIEIGDSEEVFVVIEGRPSQRARSRIQRVVAGTIASFEESDEDEDEDEEGAEADDDLADDDPAAAGGGDDEDDEDAEDES
jgi:hypothetical protein